MRISLRWHIAAIGPEELLEPCRTMCVQSCSVSPPEPVLMVDYQVNLVDYCLRPSAFDSASNIRGNRILLLVRNQWKGDIVVILSRCPVNNSNRRLFRSALLSVTIR
jgi:hypothetical protein